MHCFTAKCTHVACQGGGGVYENKRYVLFFEWGRRKMMEAVTLLRLFLSQGVKMNTSPD